MNISEDFKGLDRSAGIRLIKETHKEKGIHVIYADHLDGDYYHIYISDGENITEEYSNVQWCGDDEGCCNKVVEELLEESNHELPIYMHKEHWYTFPLQWAVEPNKCFILKTYLSYMDAALFYI